MKYFANILKQFTHAQRLIVLILLLSFTTGSYLIAQYLKTDDCKPIIEENLKMHEDFAKISSMLREARMIKQETLMDTVKIIQIDDGNKVESHPMIIPDSDPIMDRIYKIAQSNQKIK